MPGRNAANSVFSGGGGLRLPLPLQPTLIFDDGIFAVLLTLFSQNINIFRHSLTKSFSFLRTKCPRPLSTPPLFTHFEYATERWSNLTDDVDRTCAVFYAVARQGSMAVQPVQYEARLGRSERCMVPRRSGPTGH